MIPNKVSSHLYCTFFLQTFFQILLISSTSLFLCLVWRLWRRKSNRRNSYVKSSTHHSFFIWTPSLSHTHLNHIIDSSLEHSSWFRCNGLKWCTVRGDRRGGYKRRIKEMDIRGGHKRVSQANVYQKSYEIHAWLNFQMILGRFWFIFTNKLIFRLHYDKTSHTVSDMWFWLILEDFWRF